MFKQTQPILGTRETVKRFDDDMIRSYYQTNYSPYYPQQRFQQGTPVYQQGGLTIYLRR